MNKLPVNYNYEDVKIFNKLILSLSKKRIPDSNLNEQALLVGKKFLGAPYLPNTLESYGDEILTINLRMFDCFTFVENVVALTRLLNNGENSFENFIYEITRIRYRFGFFNTYDSRLHYFSDWLKDNEEKGIVKDMTREIGGLKVFKKINFMTRHLENYPALKIEVLFKKMLSVEDNLSDRPLYFIPKEKLSDFEDKIESGYIIGIATNIDGLDVIHVGFALKKKKGIHLLHASGKYKKVVISKNTLNHYLYEEETRSGILVGRIEPILASQNDDNRSSF